MDVFSQPDVLQLQEVGDFEAQNCLPALNLIRSTKLHLTTEPPISCRCCYRLAFLSVVGYVILSLPNYSFLVPNQGTYFSITLKSGGLSSCDLLSNVLLGFCAVMKTSCAIKADNISSSAPPSFISRSICSL